MKIGITGATGFIGTRLIELAAQRGHTLIGFTREPKNKVRGCAETRAFRPNEAVNLTGCEAVVHLAGERIVGLWTPRKKRRILNSRQFATRHLVNAILTSSLPPRILVSGSGVGFYGDTGERVADETAAAGDGFLANVCKNWEAEAQRAEEKNLRVVLIRTGHVLGARGGLIAAMRPVFRAALGGNLGSGEQWTPWIHVDDEARLILFALENENVRGPLNATAPNPCRNADFTQALADAVHRPALFSVPAPILKIALGGLGKAMVSSQRVVPKKAIDSGFSFEFPTLSKAIADIFQVENRNAKA
ncbi:MAG: TIGR01777 family oxidoreductase [Verrucomicrobiota bacterium]|nr:TIGR01777 family oxidoreductase [Verrucomicrobiota bacterium]